MDMKRLCSTALTLLCLLVPGSEPLVAQDSPTTLLLPDVGGNNPKQLVRVLLSGFQSGDLEPLKGLFTSELWERLYGHWEGLRVETMNLIAPDPDNITVLKSNRDETESVYEVRAKHDVRIPGYQPGDVIAAGNIQSYWLIGYNSTKGLIDILSFKLHEPFDTPGVQYEDVALNHAVDLLGKPPFANQNSIKFLFATTRGSIGNSFSDDRAKLTFGAVDVHVPDDHKMGQMELPGLKGWSPFTYQEKLDLAKHFAISKLKTIDESDWRALVRNSNYSEALIFVHGFNNTFDDSVYRAAQVMWDLQYKGLPILFSWPSRGGATNPVDIAISYQHDLDSALTQSDTFDGFLHTLKSLGIKKVHLLVHSMGNFLVLNALRRENSWKQPIRLGEWILAAPDIDVDQFLQFVPTVQPYVAHMTLYASAMDNALLASMAARGGKPRAGFVPDGKPILMRGIDSIDVSALGGEIFGLNHDVFASNRSLIDDIGLVLDGRAPDQRLRELRPVPINPPPPKYWQFAP
jgi:esterase/lipase superfamily enzyme